MLNRKIEFTLGMIGAISSFVAGVILSLIASLATAGGVHSYSTIELILLFSSIILATFIMPTLGIIGSIKVKNKPKLAGSLLLVSAILGVTSVLHWISSIFLLIAGLMALFRKEKT